MAVLFKVQWLIQQPCIQLCMAVPTSSQLPSAADSSFFMTCISNYKCIECGCILLKPSWTSCRICSVQLLKHITIILYAVTQYCIVGNFRGRKPSQILWFFSHPRKFSPRNFRHATPIMRLVLTFRKSFLCKIPDLQKFFPLKVSRYTVRIHEYHVCM